MAHSAKHAHPDAPDVSSGSGVLWRTSPPSIAR